MMIVQVFIEQATEENGDMIWLANEAKNTNTRDRIHKTPFSS